MKQNPFTIEDIKQGDYITFGESGNYYVNNINPGDLRFRVTDKEQDRYNKFAEGWLVRKEFATALVSREEKEEEIII